ncbi:MAG: YitT family protein [Peptostreptococcaceae bacterium]|nr:YitT family protein [Peptostreptococcaceae bacterium]
MKIREKIREIKKIFKLDKKAIKKIAVDLIYILIGCTIGGFSLTAILIPNGLSSGGLTGIVRIVQSFIAVDFSILFYIGAFIIIVLVAIFLGFKEVRKVLLISILFPSVLMILEQFDFKLLEEKDIILAAIFCGILSGITSGLFFYRGYSFAGTDAIAKIIRRKFLPHMSLSQILLFVDGVIIITSAFVFGRNIALYALITQMIFVKTVDYVIYGFETKFVQLEIITDKPEAVISYIMGDISRGVTSMEVTGEYTKEKKNKLITLCSPRESMLIKKFVSQTDEMAFVTVVHVDTVWGRGQGFNDIQKES